MLCVNVPIFQSEWTNIWQVASLHVPLIWLLAQVCLLLAGLDIKIYFAFDTRGLQDNLDWICVNFLFACWAYFCCLFGTKLNWYKWWRNTTQIVDMDFATQIVDMDFAWCPHFWLVNFDSKACVHRTMKLTTWKCLWFLCVQNVLWEKKHDVLCAILVWAVTIGTTWLGIWANLLKLNVWLFSSDQLRRVKFCFLIIWCAHHMILCPVSSYACCCVFSILACAQRTSVWHSSRIQLKFILGKQKKLIFEVLVQPFMLFTWKWNVQCCWVLCTGQWVSCFFQFMETSTIVQLFLHNGFFEEWTYFWWKINK